MSALLAGQGLRHLPAPDPRDYPPDRALRRAATFGKDYRYWTAGRILDQGNTPQCVAYATAAYLLASPIRQAHPDPQGIYGWCQRNDEWPGENYEGTSVHAAMRYLAKNGFAASYEWGQNVLDLAGHIIARGPAVIGTTWWSDMANPDRWGYARVGGYNFGGHAYMIRGVNILKRDPLTRGRGAFKLVNSWGRDWGVKGEAWITFNDMAALIEDYGEIALPVEVRK